MDAFLFRRVVTAPTDWLTQISFSCSTLFHCSIEPSAFTNYVASTGQHRPNCRHGQVNQIRVHRRRRRPGIKVARVSQPVPDSARIRASRRCPPGDSVSPRAVPSRSCTDTFRKQPVCVVSSQPGWSCRIRTERLAHCRPRAVSCGKNGSTVWQGTKVTFPVAGGVCRRTTTWPSIEGMMRRRSDMRVLAADVDQCIVQVSIQGRDRK